MRPPLLPMLRTFALILPALLLCGGAAHADQKPAKPKQPDKTKPADKDKPARQPEPNPKPKQQGGEGEADAEANANPAPGTCSHIQPGVKVCSTIQGQGSFDVLTYPPATVFVMFEDAIDPGSTVLPDKTYFKAQVAPGDATIITIKPKTTSLPSRTPMTVKTVTGTTVTLNLRPGNLQSVDTQVTIKDPDREVRAEDFERRCAEQFVDREKILLERERKIEERARRRSDEQILEALAQGDTEVFQPKATARNDQLIVLRAEKVLRVGARRYLILTVENLDEADFRIAAVKAWIKDGDVERPVKAIARYEADVVESNRKRRIGVLLPLGKTKLTDKTRLRVRIEETDTSRSVELGGIRVR